MHILNINMNNISNLKCTYGLKDKNNNVTNIIKNIVTNKYNNKIYIFKLKITNKILKCDPIPGTKKNFLYF